MVASQLARLVTVAHVATGSIVLLVAPAALVMRKGGLWHRRFGAAFGWAMAVVLGTATLMWQSHGHFFLLVLDVVCAYLVFAGFRIVARRRRKENDRGADGIDLAAAAAMFVCAATLVVLAITANTPLMREIAAILIALAAVAASFAVLDARALLGRVRTPLGSLLVHISAMMGAYISAVTAFCVINAHGVPMLLRWIVPSVAGTAVIARYSIEYRRRFARRTRTGRALTMASRDLAR